MFTYDAQLRSEEMCSTKCEFYTAGGTVHTAPSCTYGTLVRSLLYMYLQYVHVYRRTAVQRHTHTFGQSHHPLNLPLLPKAAWRLQFQRRLVPPADATIEQRRRGATALLYGPIYA